jgi:hypothetical protein
VPGVQAGDEEGRMKTVYSSRSKKRQAWLDGMLTLLPCVWCHRRGWHGKNCKRPQWMKDREAARDAQTKELRRTGGREV